MIRRWRKNWDETIPTFAQKRKCAHWNTARRSHKKPTKTSAKCQVVAGARKVDDALCFQGLAYWNLWSGDQASKPLSTGTCARMFECRFELCGSLIRIWLQMPISWVNVVRFLWNLERVSKISSYEYCANFITKFCVVFEIRGGLGPPVTIEHVEIGVTRGPLIFSCFWYLV